MTAAALALATLLWGQVSVTVEPPPRRPATAEPIPACRRRCAAVEKALARADLSRPESLEPLVAAWEGLVQDGTCVLPELEPCWPGDRRELSWEDPASNALDRLAWLATPVDGVSPPDHRALRIRAQRALIHPCTLAALNQAAGKLDGGSVLDLASYVATGALTEGEMFRAERRRAPPVEARASTTLAPVGRITYDARNVLDGSYATAWCEGKRGSGEGEWIEVSVPAANPIRELLVVRGYAKGVAVFRRNDRPDAIRIAPCDAPDSGEVWDQRGPDYQPQFEVPAVEAIGTPRTRCVRLTIVHVHPGKDADACISEILPVTHAPERPPISIVPERCPAGPSGRP